jgi:hypothetical protein
MALAANGKAMVIANWSVNHMLPLETERGGQPRVPEYGL